MNFDKAKEIVSALDGVIKKISQNLAGKCADDHEISVSRLDTHQMAVYDYTYLVAEFKASQIALETLNGRSGGDVNLEGFLTQIFISQTAHHLLSTIYQHVPEFGLAPADISVVRACLDQDFVRDGFAPKIHEQAADLILSGRQEGAQLWLSEDHMMFRDTFRKFAQEKIKPLAEKIHRQDLLVPEDIISGLAELGCFGLCLPQRYGGFQDDNKPDNTGMVVVTEELSRASLGVAGSLITRPEILAKALLKGGTEEQKQKWPPLMASGKKMVAVAVTEPDYGSDVAGMRFSAEKTKGGWLLNGCKTWCTFAGYADVLLVLARTNPDLNLRHKGLSLFMAEKPRFKGHEFDHTQEDGGRISGRAIGTIGYRGMHSYECFFDNYFVPDENLIGGDEGLGKGFYLQMAGFAAGRLQTAARALGVMQAAFDEAVRYAMARRVFGKPLSDYQLTRYKLARMAGLIHVIRQFTYHAARLMDQNQGDLEASMVKIYASRTAEWITREAMQIHGGMGYAEEFPVSRYFVDARVFSIFEGAEETLILRVVGRQLLEQALS